MNLVTRAARAGLHQLGGIGVFRARHRSALRILMYHRFPPDPAALRSHCEHICRFYQPVSMAQVSAALHTGAALPPNAVAVTIDDGYRDFLLNAHPVFLDFEIPTTVFLVADFIDRKSWLWWNRIEYAFAHTPHTRIDLDAADARLHAALDTPAQRWTVARTFAESLVPLPNDRRLSAIETALAALNVDVPHEPPPGDEPMYWDEVRSLAKTNVEFGAHTKTHPILSSLSGPAAIEDEIRGSKKRVEEELGKPVTHFCYPNGKNADIGPEAIRITRESGFETAVTTEPGMNRVGAGADAFQLRRIGVPLDCTPHYFAELLAGVRAS